MSAGTEDLGGFAAMLVSFVLGRISTISPGVIVAYDPATQRATVQPSLTGKRKIPGEDRLESFNFPPRSNLPVLWPRGGDGALTFPILMGDPVTLVTAERSIDEWKDSPTPEPAPGAPPLIHNPADPRRFDRSDTIVIPGLHRLVSALPPTAWAPGATVLSGSDVRIGNALTAVSLALAPLVDAAVADIASKFNLHTHAGAGSPPVPLIAPVGSVAATNTKGS